MGFRTGVRKLCQWAAFARIWLACTCARVSIVQPRTYICEHAPLVQLNGDKHLSASLQEQLEIVFRPPKGFQHAESV